MEEVVSVGTVLDLSFGPGINFGLGINFSPVDQVNFLETWSTRRLFSENFGPHVY